MGVARTALDEVQSEYHELRKAAVAVQAAYRRKAAVAAFAQNSEALQTEKEVREAKKALEAAKLALEKAMNPGVMRSLLFGEKRLDPVMREAEAAVEAAEARLEDAVAANAEKKEFVFENAFEGDVPRAEELQSMTAEELDTTSSIFTDPAMLAHTIDTFHQGQEQKKQD